MITTKWIKLFLVFSFLINLSSVFAQDAGEFIEELCMVGFNTTNQIQTDKIKFCKCVKKDIKSKINSKQTKIVLKSQADIKKGKQPDLEKIRLSGIKELIIASKENCKSYFHD